MYGRPWSRHNGHGVRPRMARGCKLVGPNISGGQCILRWPKAFNRLMVKFPHCDQECAILAFAGQTLGHGNSRLSKGLGEC